MGKFGKAALLGGAIVMAAPEAASAQEAPKASDGTPATEADIIVTAQRRAERLETVPMSVSVASADTIARSGITNISQLGAIAPGVQINAAGSATQPAIRGITSLTNVNGLDNNVAIYVDGFYVADPQSINADLANVESIQILKGPQGTLYGRNATGGAILITTKAPSDVLTARAEFSYATFDDKAFTGYLSGPLSDAVRVSLAGYSRRTDGYIKLSDPQVAGSRTDKDAFPIRQQSLRFKLEGDVTSQLTATLGLNYGLSDDPRGNNFTVFDHIAPTIAAPPLRATADRTASYNYDAQIKATTKEATLSLVYRGDFGSITSLTGYARRLIDQAFDFDGTYADTTYAEQRFGDDSFQQSLDLVLDRIGRLDLVVGASYFNGDVYTRGPDHRITYGPGKVPLNRIILDLQAEAFAGYVDATWHVTDALSINAGARYTSETKRIELEQTGTGAFPQIEREKTFRKLTPRASIRYELAPRANVYASYSRGFRSGNFPTSGTPAVIEAIKPEVVDAFEVGFKVARRAVRFDAALFYYDDKDLHVSLLTPVCVGTVCTIQTRIANAPKAEIYGAEAQVDITPARGLNLRAGVAYLHARYRDFPNASGTGLNVATDRNVSNQTQDWSDQQMARSPTMSGNIGIDYTTTLAGGKLEVSGNFNYTDSYVINNPSLYGPLAGALANTQRYRQPAYGLLNLQLTWTDPSDHYYIGVFGRNVTDTRYRMTYTGSVNGDYGTLAFPRQIGLRVGARL